MSKLMKMTDWVQHGIYINRHIGSATAWLVLIMALSTLVTVALRYIWGIGAINLQELSIYAFALIWWLCAPLALEQDAHVRVDILYQRCSTNLKKRVDSLGHLFLLAPTGLLLAWVSHDYVINSWAMKEVSTEPGGLPWVYLLKTLLIVGPVLLTIQAILMSCRINVLKPSSAEGLKH